MVDNPLQFEKWIAEDTGPPSLPAVFAGLDDLAKAAVAVTLFQRTPQPVFAVFGSRQEARNFIDNITFFGGHEVEARTHYLPPIEFDYHRGLFPNPEMICERNVTLIHALKDPKKRIFVTTSGALLQKMIPPPTFLESTLTLEPNAEWEREKLSALLQQSGYQRQPTAFDPGTFSIRGGVIDIFSPLYPKPFRLEFYGDLIDNIRHFDPQTQLSAETLEQALAIPVSLSLLPFADRQKQVMDPIKTRLDAQGISKSLREEILENLRSQVLLPEHSFLFPLVSGGAVPVQDYFPSSEMTYLYGGWESIAESVREIEIPKIQKQFALFENQPIPIAEYRDLFLFSEEFFERNSLTAAIDFSPFETKITGNQYSIQSEETRLNVERAPLRGKGGSKALLESFAQKFRDWMDHGYRIHIASHTSTHAEHVAMLFRPYGIECKLQPESSAALPSLLTSNFSNLHLWQGFLSQSRIYPRLRLVLLSEEELFGHKKRVAKSQNWATSDPSRILSTFRDINVGDYIVHRDFGIGRYLGLKSMEFQGTLGDYVLLEYRDGDKLYIPIYRLNILQKYVGAEGGNIPLDKLGGDSWSKVKGKAQKAIAELAAEFLQIQAKRKLIPAHAFSQPTAEYQEFEMEFPFDETPDQQKSIDEVQHDLGQAHPMDRLLCGDVGYGKTEVAMRATFRAVNEGKQVAILVPTTVLAFQHYENFKKRFATTGASVDMVCRLRSNAEIKTTIEGIKTGKVDVIIGTHRLLSSDVEFRDLGLLVIDEEHRFGVVHKEKLKKLSESIHVLSMTATPIPRTLNMAMTGIKEISIITTPPPDRLSVRTFVCRKSDEVTLEAIQNEVARDGQVFFVHNRIETIFGVADDLRRLLPRLKFEIVHGQMDGEELEKRMLAFYRGEAQVLLTTAIIESGLDIPRANTILIDRADHFGLAQLYQLRGRVGRSEKRAYCYLLVPSETQITPDAKQRLQVIQRYSDLGGGFQIASQDLEIRGAGDLLGKDQSGHIAAIGVDMYFELLEEAIAELKGQEKKMEIEPEITMKLAAYFPNDYLPDVGERVQIYRKLSAANHEDTLAELESEIRDRFGSLPDEVKNLLGLMTIKIYLKRLHVTKMNVGPKRTSLQFAPSTPASPAKLVKLISKNPDEYQLTPDQKFVFASINTTWQAQLEGVRKLCDFLEVSGG